MANPGHSSLAVVFCPLARMILSPLLALALMADLSQALLLCGLFSRWKPWCRQDTPRPININVPIPGNDDQTERCEAITCYYVVGL